MPDPVKPSPTSVSPLFTDLYELTMLRAYHAFAMDETAVFSLYARKLPPTRNFLVACGLDSFVHALQSLRFSQDELGYLATLGKFPDEFLHWLSDFRFTGDVYAVPEGTIVFGEEPILEVIAPIAEAQLIETLAVNQIGLQTMLASKATRVVHAAQGRSVVDFGTRRAQGIDASVTGARAFHIAGVSATSNVLAGQSYGIPVAGTVAHSFVESFASEIDAFRSFARVFPDTTLLVDTYDTLNGVERVIELAYELGNAFKVAAIRLDSGDLLALSREARRKLDAAGLMHVQIFASGGLDEKKVDRLVRAGAPIEGFGVGTDMSVSGDAPSLDLVYKLTEYAGIGRLKLSSDKRTLPGRKQIFREFRKGVAHRDMIGRFDEDLPGEPLLVPVMRDGEAVVASLPALADIRSRATQSIGQLPRRLRSLRQATPPYEVEVSPGLALLESEVRERLARQNR